jgi:LysM repeat protein
LLSISGFLGIILIAIYLIFFREGQGVNFSFFSRNFSQAIVTSVTSTQAEELISSLSTSTPLTLLGLNSPTPAISTPVSSEPAPTNTVNSSPISPLTPTQAIPTPGPGLGTPFGPNEAYVLYQVLEGHSITAIAAEYQTTVEVIRKANNMIEGESAWPGSILVILPGQRNAEAVPNFSIILIEAPTSVTSLSDQYGIPVEEIQRINQLGVEEMIPAGRYIILPESTG